MRSGAGDGGSRPTPLGGALVEAEGTVEDGWVPTEGETPACPVEVGKKSILQYIVVLSVAINNRYTDGKYRYFITTHIMDLPRCHCQYLISPVLFVGALIP